MVIQSNEVEPLHKLKFPECYTRDSVHMAHSDRKCPNKLRFRRGIRERLKYGDKTICSADDLLLLRIIVRELR